ncbi:organomercurial lyase [Staphylococcus simulans]|uniref:organomercurial lyase n=1 Tax=Staphylococcus simulans TaxID=1286 RepID=UPI00399A58C9
MQYFNFDALLTPHEHQLRQALIQDIVEQPTTPPAFTEAHQALLDKHVIVVQDHLITCLYPFATHPTSFIVQLQDHTTVYAMCAIDALGIHYTLNEPIKIEAQCAETKAPIQISLKDGQLTTDYKEAYVLFKNLCSETQCADSCCPEIQFFVSKQALDQYYHTHINQNIAVENHTTYHALPLNEANTVAKEIFEIRETTE